MGVLCKNILQNLSPNRFEVTVIGTNQQLPTDYSFCTYKPVKSLNIMVGQHDPIIFSMLNQMAYVDEVDKVPDVVHCFDWSTFGAGLFLKQKYNCKLICSIQLALSDITERVNPLQTISFDHGKAIEMQGLMNSDIVIQVSSHYAKKYFMFLDKTAVINNGIDCDKFKTPTKILELPGTNKTKLLYIGRYAEMKNTHVLSSINLPDGVDLLFAGNDRGSDPQVYQMTRNNIKNNKNMYFIGEYHDQDKIDLFHSVDGVIFPSVREPFGIVGLEALAAGKILLASNVDGMKDYLNDDNSINCGTTAKTIEQAIEKFKSLTHSEKIKFKEKAQETAKLFDWKLQSSKYESVYSFLTE